MAIPSRGLYIDVPGKGTALLWFDLKGDQFDPDNVFFCSPAVAWKAIGATSFVDLPTTPNDEAAHLFYSFSGPQMVFNMARASDVDVSKWVTSSGSVAEPGALGPRAVVEWLLNKPKQEADAVLAKFWREVAAPKIGAFLTFVLKPFIGDTSTPVGGYSNLDAYFTAQLEKYDKAVTAGDVKVSRAA